MGKIKLSIIVPVCNVEKYLPECLDSILRQTEYPMEVICVNDGSTDKSLEILLQYEKHDDRICIISKPNSGYGDSMNAGIKNATGDYISIVESDDVVVSGSFEKLLSAAEKTNSDVVKGNFNFYIAEDNKKTLYPNFQELPYGEIISTDSYPILFFTAPAIWSGIYKKSFLLDNSINFLPTPGASYQDTSFAFKIWASANSVYLLPDPIIDYRQDSSNSSSNTSKKVFNIFYETKEMERFLIEHHLEHFYPEFAKTKFISYGWTLNRLNANDKRKFFLLWLPDLKNDFEHGYFVKKYWEDCNWIFIHQMIFNPEKYIDLACKGEDIPSPLLLDNLQQLVYISPIYVYGAGKYGIKKKQELETLGITVSAFIVSEKGNNPDYVCNLPVIPLNQIDRDGIIFIGVSNKYKEEILNTLRKNWLMNNLMTTDNNE